MVNNIHLYGPTNHHGVLYDCMSIGANTVRLIVDHAITVRLHAKRVITVGTHNITHCAIT